MRLEAAALAGLPCVGHGFFERRGGVSEGPFASLNVGLRGGDLPERVAENRARAAAALGAAPTQLVVARQVHGTHTHTAEAPWDDATAPEADALVTCQPGLLLGVLTADCAPVLLADATARVVAAAHAGWKGALEGILDSVVAAMEKAGAAPSRIVAAVGPCIAQQSYEVGPEFVARFAAADAASLPLFDHSDPRARFDLKRYVVLRLVRLGVRRVEVLPEDTCREEDRFFSFRRTTLRGEGRFGLQLSAIALTE